jgi:LysM repeat protein
MRAGLVLVVVVLVIGQAGPADGARAGTRGTERYVVVPGDSLTSIAQHFGISLSRLVRANGLDRGATLQIGTRLQIPVVDEEAAAPSVDWAGVYEVGAGDTLSGIAARDGVPIAQLARANGLDPAGLLLSGSKLKVPTPNEEGLSITVRAGDTLSGIAARYGVSLATISSLNHIQIDAVLPVGERLVIPRAVVGSTALLQRAAAQEVDPYASAAQGADVSYPNCGRGHPPGSDFTVVGLNDGRPFTTNPCFEVEYAEAASTGAIPSVYLNVAYAPTLLRRITPDCSERSRTQSLPVLERRAYAVGCSEAEAAQEMLAGARTSALWLDVEPANTWSKHPALNRAAITGVLATLLGETSTAIGIYSSPLYWGALTGGWSDLALPEWIATDFSPDQPACPAPFAAGPVWLSQHTAPRQRRDHDTAC